MRDYISEPLDQEFIYKVLSGYKREKMYFRKDYLQDREYFHWESL